MFEADRSHVLRAYVPASHDSEADLALALTWLSDEGGKANSLIGVQIPSRGDIDESPTLSELERRGRAAFSTWRRTSTNRRVSGAQLAYFPNSEMLLALETARSSVIVAVGVDSSHAPWITAYEAQPLSGATIVPVPAADPVVVQALHTFTNAINSSTGLTDSRDRSKVIDGLQKLRRAGIPFTAEQLVTEALRRNWKGSAAHALGVARKSLLAKESSSGRPSRRTSSINGRRRPARTET